MKFTLFLVLALATFRLSAQEDRRNLNMNIFEKNIVNSSKWRPVPLNELGIVRKATFNVMKREGNKYEIVLTGELNNGSMFAFVSGCELKIEDDFFILFLDHVVGEVPPAIYGYFNSKNELIFAFSGQKELKDLDLSTLNWLKLVR